MPEKLPALMIFNNLDRLISDVRDIQADDKNPNDCAKEPHDVTHSVDMLRYYCVSRQLAAEEQKAKIEAQDEFEQSKQDYTEWMCGDAPTEDYMNY